MSIKINTIGPVLERYKSALLFLGLLFSLIAIWSAPSVYAAQCYANGVVADCSTFPANAFQTIPGGIDPDGCYRQGGVTAGPIGGEQVQQFSPESCDSTVFGGQEPEGTPPAVSNTPGTTTTSNAGVTYQEGDCQPDRDEALSEENCGIIGYLVIIINVLSALVAVVVLGSIIYAGVQYSMAGSDPSKVSAAKERIRNALIALFFFMFMYGFLNFLIPGGVL
jgi:hypothetical protein